MAESLGIDADLEGSASPPRDNGEIVFAAPWERHVFGLTVAFCRSGAVPWESFRRRLTARIVEDEPRPYWQSWAAALEDLLTETAMLTTSELDLRYRALLGRPPVHADHD